MELSTDIFDEALSGTGYKCTRSITYHELHFSPPVELEMFEVEFTDGERFARAKIETRLFAIVPDKLEFIKQEVEPLLEALRMQIH